MHIIATTRNRPIEIQVRTELQHLWAQLSERLSDARDPAIKYGGGDPTVRELLSRMSELIGSFEDTQLLAAVLSGRLRQGERKIRRLLDEAMVSLGGSERK